MHITCFHCMIVLVVFTPGIAFGDTAVSGTTFGLPPEFKAITDVQVEVKLFRPRQNPNRPGELLRNAFGNLVPDGKAIAATVTGAKGEYRLPVPIAERTRSIFILTFNRKDQVITQEVSGIVLQDGVPVRLDIIVPKPATREVYYGQHVRSPQCYHW